MISQLTYKSMSPAEFIYHSDKGEEAFKLLYHCFNGSLSIFIKKTFPTDKHRMLLRFSYRPKMRRSAIPIIKNKIFRADLIFNTICIDSPTKPSYYKFSIRIKNCQVHWKDNDNIFIEFEDKEFLYEYFQFIFTNIKMHMCFDINVCAKFTGEIIKVKESEL